MATGRRGWRRIVVEGASYRWRLSRAGGPVQWRSPDPGEVDAGWLEEARRVGLGDIADTHDIVIVLGLDTAGSRLFIRCPVRLVDGFLGIAPLTVVTPGQVRAGIERGLAAGWSPAARGDVTVRLDPLPTVPAAPPLLVLPGVTRDIPDYANRAPVVPLYPAPADGVARDPEE